MTARISLIVALVVSATSVWAQKPVERLALEIGNDYLETTVNQGNSFVSNVDGTVRQIAFLDHAVTPGAPEDMARQYLHEQASTFRMDASNLEHLRTRSGLSGHVVSFVQTINGVPVHNSETIVNIDNQNRVQFVHNGTRSALNVDTTPALSGTDARRMVHEHLSVSGTIHYDRTELVIYMMDEGARLAWQVRVEAASPNGDWQAMVDAHTGELLRVANIQLYHGDDEEGENEPISLAPTAASHQLMMRVDGTGFIFDPDPLAPNGATYGDPGYIDGGDANTPQLEAARVAVTLRDITLDGGLHYLEGPWAELLDWDIPFTTNHAQAGTDFSATRDAEVFEAVTAYWHIDNYMRYVNNDLGIAVQPSAYPTGVRFDPNGFSGADNSSYSSGTQRLRFGAGGVDDDEDADVIIHELGHGLHDWLAVGLSNGDGLSEGFGDYVAVSYSRGLGFWSPSDAEYNWVFKWDGHNPFWPGRICNWTADYPAGSAPHQRGQHWCTANMKIWDDIGQQETDTAVMEGLTMTGPTTSQPQAAQAVLQAAANMGYSNADLTTIFTHYTDQGYNVTLPVSNEGGPESELPNEFELTAAYPNPFNPAANFTLRVGDAQRVSIALYDVLGRQVRSIFSGQMSAGERRVFTIDASSLPSGLYVYRAVGEGFSDSRSVVLAK
ncbi:MAG: T9SS type A sorting domain-containing protein [Rubricoccaceae bacterium]|nr:T9SS type A sorting domain-containing protein [Rubricoccaceae bacterium]